MSNAYNNPTLCKLTLVREELTKYGLNPAQWEIRKLSTARPKQAISLRNRFDSAFRLRAQLEATLVGGFKITELSVVSL